VGQQGPTGLKGDQGDVGPIGPTGFQGIPGLDGVAGAAGLTGPQGIQGPQGYTGQRGPTGSTGATGPIGLPGVNGITPPSLIGTDLPVRSLISTTSVSADSFDIGPAGNQLIGLTYFRGSFLAEPNNNWRNVGIVMHGSYFINVYATSPYTINDQRYVRGTYRITQGINAPSGTRVPTTMNENNLNMNLSFIAVTGLTPQTSGLTVRLQCNANNVQVYYVIEYIPILDIDFDANGVPV